VVFVGTGTDEAERLPIGGSALLHQPADAHLPYPLGDSGQTFGPEIRRDLIEQGINTVDANSRQHGAYIVFGVGDKRHDSLPQSDV
jgi:hypothetical protein